MTIEFFVTGRVQGVFFRQSTTTKATQLGLVGWVQNLPDGRVQGQAQGADAAIEQLQNWLRQGPPQARVDDLQVQQLDDDRVPLGDSFEVRR